SETGQAYHVTQRLARTSRDHVRVAHERGVSTLRMRGQSRETIEERRECLWRSYEFRLDAVPLVAARTGRGDSDARDELPREPGAHNLEAQPLLGTVPSADQEGGVARVGPKRRDVGEKPAHIASRDREFGVPAEAATRNARAKADEVGVAGKIL